MTYLILQNADFYLCEDSDITLISDNNPYNMKALAQEALKLRVPNSLTVIDLNNFYVGMIPIDHNQILTMIPHIDTTNIPFNHQKITNFIGSKIFGVGKYFHSKSTRP